MGNERKFDKAAGSRPDDHSWWKTGVVYQIYPRSFMDSNGDGIGDIPGIISRLDYIASLGVDIIWLNPIFSSPDDDNGYDVSDYRTIAPEYGTMRDFEDLLHGLHRRGLRLVLDMVLNHTSDEHEWFRQARTSRDNPYYGFYHWWPAERGVPPYRDSFFDVDGTAWKYNDATDSFYLHYFSVRQPDLNWENPRLRENMYDIMRFWLDKGVDGFRLDAVSFIAKDDAYPEIDLSECPYIFDHLTRAPHLHEYLHEMNRLVFSRYDIMTVGEGSSVCADDVWKFVDPHREELNMLYGFGPSQVRNYSEPDVPDSPLDYSLVQLKKMFEQWDRAVKGGWPAVYLGNHDQPRMVSRFGSQEDQLRELSAKMLATFLLTMRGTPFWYAGDEIAMANIRFTDIDDYNDVSTRNHYEHLSQIGGDLQAYLREQADVGRDNARTPMQWTSGPNAGFTVGTPWLRVNPDHVVYNVQAQQAKRCSVLEHFRSMVRLRRSEPCLLYGDFTLVGTRDPSVFAYTREYDGRTVLVVLNFTAGDAVQPQETGGYEMIAGNYREYGRRKVLRPFEARVYKKF